MTSIARRTGTWGGAVGRAGSSSLLKTLPIRMKCLRMYIKKKPRVFESKKNVFNTSRNSMEKKQKMI